MSTTLIPHDHGQPTQGVLERMPSPDAFADAAATFQQIGDGSRLRILWLLCLCEECVCYIAAAVGMSYNQLCEEIVRLSCDVKRRG